MIPCDMVPCDMVPCNMVPCYMVPYDAIKCGTCVVEVETWKLASGQVIARYIQVGGNTGILQWKMFDVAMVV